jgi:hypothetical protein
VLGEPIAIAFMEIVGRIKTVENDNGCCNVRTAIDGVEAEDDLIDCSESSVGDKQHGVWLKYLDEADRIAIRRKW